MPIELYDHTGHEELPKWLVEEMFPRGSEITIAGKSNAGKSFFVEWLIECIIHGLDFMGRKTCPSSVLLIDEDTPECVLKHRLSMMNNAIGVSAIKNLHLACMKGYSLSNMNSLVSAIDESGAKVIVIDSLHRLLGGKLEPNRAKDMEKLSELKSRVLTKGRTLIIIHHVSAKNTKTVDEIMSEENPGSLLMGSSTIIEITDTCYIIGSKTKSDLHRIYVKPMQKRIPLKVKPFTAMFEENKEKNTMEFVFEKDYKPNPIKFGVDKDILKELLKHSKRMPELIEALDGIHGKWSVQMSVERLRLGGILIVDRPSERVKIIRINPKKREMVERCVQKNLPFRTEKA